MLGEQMPGYQVRCAVLRLSVAISSIVAYPAGPVAAFMKTLFEGVRSESPVPS